MPSTFYHNHILMIINNYSDKIVQFSRLYSPCHLIKDGYNPIILKCGCGKYFSNLYLEQ